MKKLHLHAVRGVEAFEPNRLIKQFFIIEASEDRLTFDDVLKFNEDWSNEFEFGFSYYVGYMTIEEFEEKYKTKGPFYIGTDVRESS
ncbi:hypothetical protein AVT64_gp49 [Acinetobacter phage YMC11/12/R2315]|uniref:Uncharacterized protein n=6 Tax=Obolenskvirus TaxID=1915205 RepID=A0A0D4DC91_9CAUD|nr:hypothetical protein LD30_gp12 [Acinetobacter phage YMC-13-01-C62]YP_009203568.1 hypothetical protein AVT64_gp49 [Acinetobacter phage YMC11/12/R2315]YP_009291937.1 hypothetical protein BI012_gp65 [Acinetobacter phage LZ35]YP_009592191.1 hypothetical protein FDG67_gp40 [Acinetobacter phage vB_AbaM-IME-AB2]YP_009609921.1 hypothetical protein FDI25_gp68 [Acinetobacter phage AbP2]AJT61451.1 hypothetical protein ABA1215_00550 [Acinetobacter phage YMC11/12/R1215]AYP68865.1 hypothetical protein [